MEKLKSLITYFRNNIWKDPVWSKVISAGILGFISSLLYFFNGLIARKSVSSSIDELYTFFIGGTVINNTVLVIAATICLIAVYSFGILVVNKYEKARRQNTGATKEKYPLMYASASAIFADRLAQAFPAVRGRKQYDNPKDIVKRLEILLQEPLKFFVQKENEVETYQIPIWWFRGYKSLSIESFSVLKNGRCLIGSHELRVKKLIVNIAQDYNKNYIYLESKEEMPTGLTDYRVEDIMQEIKKYGYAEEEYALSGKTPVTREEYDDAAYERNGKIFQTANTQLRKRHLSDFNLIITSIESTINSNLYGADLERRLNYILANRVSPDSLLNFIDTLDPKFKNYKQFQ